jgi:hypothetical protein
VNNPATVIKSMGLPADAPVVMVFASPSGKFYRDVITSRHLAGLSHLENFTVIPNSSPLTGTMQKLMPTLTQTATNPNHRAVSIYAGAKTFGTNYL